MFKVYVVYEHEKQNICSCKAPKYKYRMVEGRAKAVAYCCTVCNSQIVADMEGWYRSYEGAYEDLFIQRFVKFANAETLEKIAVEIDKALKKAK